MIQGVSRHWRVRFDEEGKVNGIFRVVLQYHHNTNYMRGRKRNHRGENDVRRKIHVRNKFRL